MLAEEYPEIAKLWHPTKNGAKTPNDVSSKSSSYAWWICPETKEAYRRQIYSQTTRQSPSPFVLNKEVSTGYNDILTKCPVAKKYWDYDKNETNPSNILFNSPEKAWWKNPKTGHSVQREINATVKNLLGKGKKRIKNDDGDFFSSPKEPLSKTQKELVKTMWDYSKNTISPEEITEGSRKAVWWKCPQYNYSYQRQVFNQVKSGITSPLMTASKTVAGINDLNTTHPEIAKNWHPSNLKSPTEVTAKSEYLAIWYDPEHNDTYERTVIQQVKSEGRSPIGHGGTAKQGNNIARHYPHIAALLHPTKNGNITAEDIAPKSKTTYWWFDKETGQSFRRTPNDMVMRSSLPPCASSSAAETEIIKAVLSNYTKDIIHHDRLALGNGKELDIHMPEDRFAIEYNGVYWHSDKWLDSDYHKNKYIVAGSNNINLLMVWSDDYTRNKEIVIDTIFHKLNLSKKPRVFARNTEIAFLSFDEAEEFCSRYQVSRFEKNFDICIGLVDCVTKETVAISTWKKEKLSLTMNNCCTSNHVVGGLGKMVKCAERHAKDNCIDKLIAYADLSQCYKGSFEKVGFKYESFIEPTFMYQRGDKRFSEKEVDYKFFKENNRLIYDKSLSLEELVVVNNLYKVWDCGKIKYAIEV